jgi:two-component system LytT family response regulator
MKKIRALIADDEKFARDGIVMLISKLSDVEVIATCCNGEEAINAINDFRPDLVFLDVQMPGMSGLDVIRTLPPAQMPLTIFVTAYDKHALQAFEVNAIDYLLKPFTDERFYAAIERAKNLLRTTDAKDRDEKLSTLLDYMSSHESRVQMPYLKKIMITEGGRIIFLSIEEIQWIEASDYYVMLHLSDKKHLIRETMATLESKLDPDQFVRIHRSSIVNINLIKELQPYGKEDYQVIMRDGRKLKMGRNWFKKLEQRLGRYS